MKNLTKLMLCSSLILAGVTSPIISTSRACCAVKAYENVVEEIVPQSQGEVEENEALDYAEDENSDVEIAPENDDTSKTEIDEDKEGNLYVTPNDEDKNQQPRVSNRRRIMVFGGGKVSVSPDIVYVTIGVESQNTDLQAATDENTAALNNVIDYLKENNVSEDDIKTKYYSIYQRHDYTTSDKFQGYQVSSGLEIKFTDLDNLSQYISDMTALGANQLNGITFDCSDPSQYYQEALKMAVEDAKNKAYALTNEDLTICGICEECVWQTMPYRISDVSVLSSAQSILKGKMEIEAKIKVIFK